VTALFKASLEVLPLLSLLLQFQDAGRVPGWIGGSICVGHSDIDNTLCPSGPEAMKEDVPMVILIHWLVGAGVVSQASFCTFSSTTLD
jgi:hypothetical protein